MSTILEKSSIGLQNGDYIEIKEKRVNLDLRAESLYPVGYDLINYLSRLKVENWIRILLKENSRIWKS